MKSLRKVLHTIVVAIAVVFTGLSDVTRAADLSISNVPLFLGGNIDPNIILSVDDSGSMDSEVLFRNNDGALWWHTVNQSFTGLDKNDSVSPDQLNFNKAGAANGTWKKYTYLFPNGTGTGLRVYSDSTDAHYAIPPLAQHAYTRSPAYNAAYFDPAVTYQPWVSYSAFPFGPIDPKKAPSDPVRAPTPTSTLDLTADVQKSGTNETFCMHNGETIPAGTFFKDWVDGNWKTAAADITITTATACNDPTAAAASNNVAIRYFPATFYLPAGTPLPAGYGYNTGSVTTNGRGPAGEALDGYEIKPANFSTSAEYNVAINNFANWFSYYRKRHLATRGGIGRAFEKISKTRVGSFAINNPTPVTMRDLDVSAERDTFYSTMYQYVDNGGTPNREALDYLGKQYMRNPGPITEACQQNFGIMFTDGYSKASTVAPPLGNVDGSMGAPFADTAPDTMADIAMHYYTTNLRPDLAAGKVPVPTACSAANPDKWVDCNDDPHQVTFGVILGIPGEIFNVNMAQTLDPFQNNPTWPTSFVDRHPSAIDDLWHATINSRGLMLEAKRPSEIADTLGAVLQDIQGRAGSASSIALNSTSLRAGSSVYQARFDSTDWSGQLLSIPILSDGTLDTADWDAADKLPTANARKIVTLKPSAPVGAKGIPFSWPANPAFPGATDLDIAQSTALDKNPSTDAIDGLGSQRLDYLRGKDVAGMRLRSKKLGDIVHSSPAFVGAPIFRYPDTWASGAPENGAAAPYSMFKSSNSTRKPLVYAGANDGMLHAFDADTGPTAGEEVFAYVPAAVYKNLNRLTSLTYAHRFFVDGAPTVGDAFFDGSWHTVLVGGLRAGGQAIYALDITDPPGSSDAETDIAAKVLWEFNDVEGLLASDPDYGDKDLGDTFSEPNIVRLHNGQWAAVFGNGYNNTGADGLTTTSATGNAVLYIVDIKTGELIKKIDTGVGKAQDPKTAVLADQRPNGLATPAPIDTNGDSIVDYIYAGDLFGNLWKFDVSSSNENSWQVLGPSGGPLFVACAGTGTQCTTAGASNLRQPITTRPQVGRHPTKANGFMVYFGTGKYFETGDSSPLAQTTQTFYGVWDQNQSSPSTTLGRTNLLQQQIVKEISQGFDTSTPPDGTDDDFFDLRVTTDNPIDWDTPPSSPHRGWYMDLINTGESPLDNEGERQVTDSILRDGRIIFTTLIPSADPCDFGGTGWLMEIDAKDGSRLEFSPFDLNADGEFDGEDHVTLAVDIDGDGTPDPVPPGGKQSKVGIPPTPGVVSDSSDPNKPPKELKITSGSTGKIEVTTENPGSGNVGRRSWRELNLQ
ncbi:MAG: pilus assembly protein [Gammaproteobacteria bacterium]